jgi:hypothetical protein
MVNHNVDRGGADDRTSIERAAIDGETGRSDRVERCGALHLDGDGAGARVDRTADNGLDVE